MITLGYPLRRRLYGSFFRKRSSARYARTAASVVIQYEPIRWPSTLPVRTRSRRCEALRPVRAAASRNDNRSSAKAASERGYSWMSLGPARRLRVALVTSPEAGEARRRLPSKLQQGWSVATCSRTHRQGVPHTGPPTPESRGCSDGPSASPTTRAVGDRRPHIRSRAWQGPPATSVACRLPNRLRSASCGGRSSWS